MNDKFKRYKSNITYLDDDNNVISENKATHAIIRELDENDNLVNEIFMVKKDEFDDRMEITKEEFENMKKSGLIDESFDDKFIVK